MGADLYIKSVYQPIYEKNKPEFERWVTIRNNSKTEKAKKMAQKQVDKYADKMWGNGYFRDSYNYTSIFWRLGLSWWQDISPKLEDGLCSVELAKQLLVLVRNAPLTPVTEQDLLANHCKVSPTGRNSVKSWNKMYADKHKELIKFLEKAIKLNEPIEMSL